MKRRIMGKFKRSEKGKGKKIKKSKMGGGRGK
jgi:hypothetical protein